MCVLGKWVMVCLKNAAVEGNSRASLPHPHTLTSVHSVRDVISTE